jgi:hypothetical protein
MEQMKNILPLNYWVLEYILPLNYWVLETSVIRDLRFISYARKLAMTVAKCRKHGFQHRTSNSAARNHSLSFSNLF